MVAGSKNFLTLNKLLFAALVLMTGCSSRHGPAPVVDVKSTVPLSERARGSINEGMYIVKPGETLYSIAWRADTDVRTLSKLNHLAPPYQIFPGQKIFLSEKSAQASADKRSVNNPNKNSGQTSKKVPNEAIDLNKKQAYGDNASGEKINKKPSVKPKPFSTKVRDWRWPAEGQVIEKFSNAAQGNKGINIAGSRGDKIVAAAAGKVVYAGDALRGYGHLVIVKHNDDYLSAYAHNDQILVKEQQMVKAGDVIARMGSSDANRVMLHFEVRFRGKSVNPLKYLPKH